MNTALRTARSSIWMEQAPSAKTYAPPVQLQREHDFQRFFGNCGNGGPRRGDQVCNWIGSIFHRCAQKHIEELKDLYKSLSKIAEIAHENEFALQYAQQSINVASTTLSRIQSKENELVESFNQLNDAAFTWLMESRKEYHVKDYGYVFEKYINN